MKESKEWLTSINAFPDENHYGMTYRQWLIGQALTTIEPEFIRQVAERADTGLEGYYAIVAGTAINIADKIIEQLANE